jgi:hypothetical protein
MKRATGRIGLAALALVLAAPACIGRGGGDGGDFRATRVDGEATIQLPGEHSRTLREGDRVPVGTAIHTTHGTDVRFESGGRAIELGADTQVTLVGSGRMSLEVGHVLAEAPGARLLSFDSRGVTAQIVGGAARIERVLGRVSVGVYSGVARLDVLGRAIEIPRLRQLDLAGAFLGQRVPTPLQLSDRSPWDRRLLGDVIDFDANLQQYARGFNAEFGTEAVAPQFYFSFVSYRNDRYLQSLIKVQEPADILIGIVVAQRLAAQPGNRAGTERILNGIQALRNQRATWGLIAKEKGLDLRALLQAVIDAIRKGTAPPSSNGSTNNTASGPGPASNPRPSGSPRPRPSRSPSPGPSPSPTPTECSIIGSLLGTCDTSGGGGASSASGSCSVVGILIDPNC